MQSIDRLSRRWDITEDCDQRSIGHQPFCLFARVPNDEVNAGISVVSAVQRWLNDFNATRARLRNDTEREVRATEASKVDFYKKKAASLKRFSDRKILNPQKWAIQAEMAGVLASPRNPLHV